MYDVVDDVVVLSLAEPAERDQIRVPVRACADALTSAGARVETVAATSDQEIDQALAAVAGGARLVVASGVDAQLRAVVRRMVRRAAPPPSQRPADLPADRTVPDLPPLAVLPLDPAGADDLPARLGLPRDPVAVAAAALGERVRRLDLLRQDAPSAVTLDGALLGSTAGSGRAVPWRGRVEVDDAVLSNGDEPLIAAVVANAGGYVQPDGLPLLTQVDPADGRVAVAVAVPVRRRWRRRPRVEVRRARGRAVTVRPAVGTGSGQADGGVACLDDGVAGEVTRQRSWWVERAAWAVYSG